MTTKALATIYERLTSLTADDVHLFCGMNGAAAERLTFIREQRMLQLASALGGKANDSLKTRRRAYGYTKRAIYQHKENENGVYGSIFGETKLHGFDEYNMHYVQASDGGESYMINSCGKVSVGDGVTRGNGEKWVLYIAYRSTGRGKNFRMYWWPEIYVYERFARADNVCCVYVGKNPQVIYESLGNRPTSEYDIDDWLNSIRATLVGQLESMFEHMQQVDEAYDNGYMLCEAIREAANAANTLRDDPNICNFIDAKKAFNGVREVARDCVPGHYEDDEIQLAFLDGLFSESDVNNMFLEEGEDSGVMLRKERWYMIENLAD